MSSARAGARVPRRRRMDGLGARAELCFDAFWAYRETLLAFTGAGEALEVGCGEGRIARAPKTMGSRHRLGCGRGVMRPGATLVISLVHPFWDRGRFTGPEADAPFVLEDSYFGRRYFEGREERAGLSMHFAGWSQPLKNYAQALEAAGLAITALREPVPDIQLQPELARWTRLPMFLWLKVRPLA